MAIPVFRVSVMKRSQGRSATAASAYRAGEKIKDERQDKTHDYSGRDGVEHAEIFTPVGAPEWAKDRETLWNEVEASEKRKDAQVCREILAALPRELDSAQNKELVRDFVQSEITSQGMIADCAFHNDTDNNNPHVHILLTMRELDGDGFSAKKNRDWNKKDVVQGWRDTWEECQNQHLEDAGNDDRISMKSYAEQGIEKETRLHMGKDATALERQGIETEVGIYNQRIDSRNTARDYIQAGLTEYSDFQEMDTAAADYELDNRTVNDNMTEQRQIAAQHMANAAPLSPQQQAILASQAAEEYESVRDAAILSYEDIDMEILDEYAGFPERGEIHEPEPSR